MKLSQACLDVLATVAAGVLLALASAAAFTLMLRIVMAPLIH